MGAALGGGALADRIATERYGAGISIHLHDGATLGTGADRPTAGEAGVAVVTTAVSHFPVPPIKKLRAAGHR